MGNKLCIAALLTGTALVSCTIDGIGARYTVGGTVTGLLGSGLVLQDNAGHTLAVSANGSFTFPSGFANAAAYSISVQTQPSNPAQTCSVRNGAGSIDKAAVTNVLVSCSQTGRFAYVANTISNTISAFTIDASSGNLAVMAGAPFADSGTQPVALALDPNGAFLFAVNTGSNSITSYAVDPNLGTLTLVGFGAATGSAPVGIAIDPLGRYAYVANSADNTVSCYSLASGQFTALTVPSVAVAAQPRSLSVDPDGNFVYVASAAGSVAVFAINAQTGVLTPVSGSPFGAGSGATALAIDPTGGFAYVANETADSVSEYAINSSGGLSAVAGSPLSTGSSPQALAIDPSGRFVFVANVGNNQLTSYSITPTSGALSAIASAGVGTLPVSVTTDPSGQFLYVVNDDSNSVSAFAIGSSGNLSALSVPVIATGNGPRGIAVD